MSEPQQRVAALFDRDPDVVFLDSAGYGLPPRATVAALEEALEGWRRGTADWLDWEDEAERARILFAGLIAAEPAEIALLPAVSLATALTLTAVPPGGEVLLAADEFRSVSYPALVTARRAGLVVREAPRERLAEAVGERTSLVALSHVHSADGAVADVAGVVAAAHAVGARVHLDATHSVGVVPARVDELGVDYLSCAAYKWLCTPRGVAFLYARGDLSGQLDPLAAGWRATGHRSGNYYGGTLELAPGAARLDLSLAWHAWVGARASLEVLASFTESERAALAIAPMRRLAALLELPAPQSPIIAIGVPAGSDAREALAAANVRTSSRAGRVRLSSHVYNTEHDAEVAAEVLRPYVEREEQVP